MFQVFVEYRPRLGTAQVFVTADKCSDGLVTTSQKSNNIIPKKQKVPTCESSSQVSSNEKRDAVETSKLEKHDYVQIPENAINVCPNRKHENVRISKNLIEDETNEENIVPTLEGSFVSIDDEVENCIVVYSKNRTEIGRIICPKEFGQISRIRDFISQEDCLAFQIRITDFNQTWGTYSLITNSVNTFSTSQDIPCVRLCSTQALENQALLISCSTCQAKFRDLRVKRLLPLPSSDWKDFAQDWFCGCCQPNKETQQKDLPSNSQLPESSLGPSLAGDIMYNRASLFISGQSLSVQDPACSEIFSVDACGTLACNACSQALGIWHYKKQMLQFWHHAIDLGSKDLNFKYEKIDPFETIKRLLAEVLEENLFQPLKVCFASNSDITDNVLIWIIETKLSLLTGVIDNSERSCHLSEKPGRILKVLFRQGNSKKDMSLNVTLITVTKNLVEVAIQMLIKNQNMIHPDMRQDNNFYISIVTL